ncbi:MAG: glutathione S-transferase N-terminal domain-containing protein [SAR324 cluster bacterium]
MPEPILHHYDESPYAEKVRLLFGLKGLAWRSVKIPRIMPKPDLMPLTGGYRRTPVLQIGADIYCDTERIAVEIERRHPAPTLFPAGGYGLSAVFGNWVAASLFYPAVRYTFGVNADKLPMEFHKDRAAMRGAEPNVERMKAEAPRARNRLRAELEWLESLLGDGRPYLLGDKPSLADCSVFHCVWYVRRGGPPVSEVLASYGRISGWMGRMDAVGHGRRGEMTSQEAPDVAKASHPDVTPLADPADAEGFRPGDKVSVTAEDTGRDPVVGELVRLAANELALSREHPAVGTVVVHFPRVGYDLRRA